MTSAAATRRPRDHQLFRQRAAAEAARYGSDPWVFVRELLQNARDAGARRLEISASREGGVERFACRDDGCGMTLEEARRYLFALYASSKDDDASQAGKFGIGFWSVLRFAPTTLTVRSRPAAGDPWQATLDGRLAAAALTDGGLADRGTEVVLERPAAAAGDFAAEVRRAVHRFGRFLGRHQDSGKPLAITVNGRQMNAEFTLPAPSAAFRGKGFRGVVGLGPEPRVELFAHGLFVRSAASLQDLRRGEERPRTSAEDALAELPSLAPRVLLDSSDLDLLLARSDARQDRHLRRMLGAAERALQLLITRQLQALRPQPWYRRWWGTLGDRLAALAADSLAAGRPGRFRRLLGRPALLSAALAALLALPVLGWLGAGALETAARRAGPGGQRAGAVAAAPAEPQRIAAGEGRFHPYSDLARRYHGPHPNRPGDGSALALAYEPRDRRLFFTALVVDDLRGTLWAAPAVPADAPPYPRIRCRTGCLAVRLLIAAGPGALRIPVPTGHRLEASSVRLDGVPLPVVETVYGEAALRFERPVRGVLEYQVLEDQGGPGGRQQVAGGRRLPAAALPGELAVAAARIRGLPLRDRVREGLRWVAGRIAYDRSPAAAQVYHRVPGEPDRDAGMADRGSRPAARGFAATALNVGAGDCDVQNALLVELLRLAGVEARLALGYVGFRGTVAPGLHAWAEVRDGGAWLVADASAVADSRVADSRAADARTGPTTAGGATPELLAALDAGHRAGALPPPPGPALTDTAAAGTIAAGLSPPPAFSRPRLATAAAILAAVALAVAVRRRGRLAPDLALDPGGDLAALLGGALRHPGAFAALPAMSHGRFVPLLAVRGGSPPRVAGSPAISLARARRLASRHRLFRSATGSDLALKAARRGVPVVDAATAEGRVLSQALGAIDLDHWSALLERGTDCGLSGGINRLLASLGQPWRVQRAAGLDPPVVELALEDLRLGRRRVLFDLDHDDFAPVREALPSRPATAVFTAFDLILHRSSVAETARERILAAAGRRALEEVDG